MRALAGRTALVTGAAGGLGRHLVRALEDEGMRVVVSARDTARLEGLGARAVAADLTSRDDVHRLAREAGEIDVLVNNAGVELTKRFTDLSDDELDAMTAVNLVAPVILTRELLGGMLARGRGHVVF